MTLGKWKKAVLIGASCVSCNKQNFTRKDVFSKLAEIDASEHGPIGVKLNETSSAKALDALVDMKLLKNLECKEKMMYQFTEKGRQLMILLRKEEEDRQRVVWDHDSPEVINFLKQKK